MAKSIVDPAAWARTQRRPTGGLQCRTCGRPDSAWMPALIAISKEVSSGRADPSMPQIHGYLQANFKYPHEVDCFRGCWKAHRGIRYAVTK